MAKLYKIKNEGGDTYHATEGEALAVLAAAGGGWGAGRGATTVEAVELDDVELREAAAKWLTLRAKNSATAKKREANRTAAQRTENAQKVWAARKKNGTDKRTNKKASEI